MNNKDSFVFPTHLFSGAIALSSGLTKRELFAAMAMQGLCVNMSEFSNSHSGRIVDIAVECADALLAQLAKEQE